MLEACQNPHDPDFLRSQYKHTLTALDAEGCNTCVLFFETLFTEVSLRKVSEFVGVDRLEGQFEVRQNLGASTSSPLSDATRWQAREALAETYDYVRAEWGNEVPDQWL